MLNRPINRWWNVVAGAIGAGLGAGPVISYSFGILGRSMITDLGWDRAVVTSMITGFLIGSGIGSLALGWLIARYGIRAPTIVMVLVWGVCLASIAIMPPLPMLFVLVFLIGGVGGGAANAMPYAVSVSGFFDAHRGLALGLVVAGSGVGSFIFPQFAETLVERFGWRTAFATIGLVSGLIPVAGLLFLVRTPPQTMTHGAAPEAGGPKPPSIVETCLRSRHFWLIALPILAISIAVFGAIGSYVFLFADRGIPVGTVTAILSVAGLSSLMGRLLVGYLLDRIFAPIVTAVVFLLAATGILLLALVPSTLTAFIAVPLIGLAIGAEADLLTFLISRYFSLRDFSRIVGIIWVIWAWGGGVGTVIMAKGYALTGSYTLPFLFFASVVVLGAILVCFIGPYRYPVHAKPNAG